MPFRWMLRVQRLVPRIAPRLLGGSLRAIERKRFIDWAFGHYLSVAHPEFVTGSSRPPARETVRVAA
jgi:digeranylgeranylglycerophospholipid reductase